MLACVDVDYQDDGAAAACVLFRAWTDESSAGEHVEPIARVEPYVPGAFYRRELPCLLAVLRRVAEPLELIIIDGYVWLKDQTHPGLGAHLFEALGRRIGVVGVAKTSFASARGAAPVVRGENASRPLFVTAAGMDVEEAARCVKSMHGPHRIPTLLRRVDQLCRSFGRAGGGGLTSAPAPTAP